MEAQLHELIEAARAADGYSRISYRDPIASIGECAIPAMVALLVDDHLGAFAVRVLDKIAAVPELRQTVLEAVLQRESLDLAEAVARDTSDLVSRLEQLQSSDVGYPLWSLGVRGVRRQPSEFRSD